VPRFSPRYATRICQVYNNYSGLLPSEDVIFNIRTIMEIYIERVFLIKDLKSSNDVVARHLSCGNSQLPVFKLVQCQTITFAYSGFKVQFIGLRLGHVFRSNLKEHYL